MTALLEEPIPVTVPSISDELIYLGWHPIFKEHTDREGNVFGDAEIRGLVEDNNQRVEDTNDLCPVVIQHRKDGAENDQELVGFLGPYKYGKVGKLKPKSAVMARLQVYRRDLDKVKKYPRLSVELWSTRSNPTKGVFDPACLLGSETPELDLGLIHYAKDRGDFEVRRYSRSATILTKFQAAYPGGSNTAIPAMIGDDESDDERRTKYSGGSLSPGDVQQILAALKPTIEEAVATAAAQFKPANDSLDAGLDVLDDPNAAGGLAGDSLMGDDDSDLEDGGDDFGDDFDDEDDSDLDDSDLEDDSDFDSDFDDDSDLDDDDSDSDLDIGDDDDDSDLDDAAGEGESSVLADSAPGDDSEDDDDLPPAKYSKLPAGDGHSSTDLETANMADAPAKNETPEQRLTRYQKERDEAKSQVATLTKERDEYRTKYQKEVDARRDSDTKLTEMTGRIDKLEASERRAVRYQKLNEKQAAGYAFDIDEEMKDCEAMTPEQFDRHCERIITRYSKIPLPGVNTSAVPLPEAKRLAAAGAEDRKRERYSKVAQDNCLRLRSEGKPVDFRAEFDRLMKDDPEKLGSAA